MERKTVVSHPVLITTLGEDIEEAVFATWLVASGDTVAAGDPIAEVMTDKVNVEIEAPVAGVIGDFLVDDEDSVRIGQQIASIEVAS